MSGEASNPSKGVPLTVLAGSGKVDELKRDFDRAPAPVPAGPGAADAASGGGVVQTPRQREIELKVLGVLRTIYDPEIPVNIYDLGLIYEVKVDETDAVAVKMTLTAPACPVAGTLPGEVEAKIEGIPEVRTASVELVWEPPWSKDRMSESAMLDLGFM